MSLHFTGQDVIASTVMCVVTNHHTSPLLSLSHTHREFPCLRYQRNQKETALKVQTSRQQIVLKSLKQVASPDYLIMVTPSRRLNFPIVLKNRTPPSHQMLLAVQRRGCGHPVTPPLPQWDLKRGCGHPVTPPLSPFPQRDLKRGSGKRP